MDNQFTPWLIGLGIPVLVSIFLRVLPKQKIINWFSPIMLGLGMALNKVLVLRFGKKAADSIEEGIFATLAAVIYAGVDSFMKGLSSDNIIKNKDNKK